MAQITLRVPDEQAAAFKAAAARAGQSLNEWATTTLRVRVDPSFAADEAATIRERLQRADLLGDAGDSDAERPDRAAVRRARAAAGEGTRLSQVVAEQRGSR